jgi:hypothetical protein
MASYTDTVPKFNPYVKQLPVEAMVKVGMYKQQKYDEGIQKIQTGIDNIAGLDVIRDVDKAYLQSKLNQLGNDLTTVAAGDFSNFQLVNSVNGMTNQIVKDPNVINAVSSAKTYRKGFEDMEAANKAGKGAASHDWEYKNQASEWLNNQDVNKTFTGGYKQYSPYQKNAQEVIKGLVKNETGKDVAFEYDKNGNMIVLDAITRTKISGITPERIKSALMVGLTPNDFQSMQIDGRYTYANSTPEQFVGDINKSYTADYDNLKQLREVTLNAIDSAKSASEKYQLQQQVYSLDKSLKDVQDEYASVSKTFEQGDAESAKARYYSTKWMNNFAQTFASKEAIQSFESSPFQQVKQFKETKAIEYRKWLATFNQNERFHKDDQYFKLRDDQRAERKLKLEEDKAAAEAFTWGGLPVDVPQDELPQVTALRVADQIEIDQDAIDKSDAALMKRFKKEGDTQWLNQQLALWQKNPGNVDARLALYFNGTEEKRRNIVANETMIADINNQMDKKYGTIEQYIPKDSKSVTVSFPTGSYTYTPKDLVNFNEKIKDYTILQTGPGAAGMYGGGGGMTYDYEKAKKELSAKDYYLFQSMINPKNSTEKTLETYRSTYFKKVNQPYASILQERNKETNQIIQERVVAMQGIQYGIPLDNESQKTSFGNVLQNFADLADSQGGGLALSPDVTAAQLRAIVPNLQNANIRVVEGTQFAPAMYKVTAADKDGATVQFNVTPEQYQSVFKGKFDPAPEIAAIRDLQSQQVRSGGLTTAFDGGKTNIGNAYMGNALNFINVRHYAVSGNLETEQNGLSSIRLNVVDPYSGEVLTEDFGYPINGLMTADKVDAAVKGLTDEIIFEMLNKRKPTAAELKQLQQ